MNHGRFKLKSRFPTLAAAIYEGRFNFFSFAVGYPVPSAQNLYAGRRRRSGSKSALFTLAFSSSFVYIRDRTCC